MLIVLVEMTGVPVDNIDDYIYDYDDDSTESKMWQDFLPHKKLQRFLTTYLRNLDIMHYWRYDGMFLMLWPNVYQSPRDDFQKATESGIPLQKAKAMKISKW